MSHYIVSNVNRRLKTLRDALGEHPFTQEVDQMVASIERRHTLSRTDIERLRAWFGGMGSLNDVWLDASHVIGDVRTANERLDEERTQLFKLLESAQ